MPMSEAASATLDMHDADDQARRIAATALGRLRGKLTYRPVVFELVPEPFTLTQLQQIVESLKIGFAE